MKKYTVKTAGWINGVWAAEGDAIDLTDEQAAYYRDGLTVYRSKPDAKPETKPEGK